MQRYASETSSTAPSIGEVSATEVHHATKSLHSALTGREASIPFFLMVRLERRNPTLPKSSDDAPIAPAMLALQGQHGDHNPNFIHHVPEHTQFCRFID